jgi:putative DNA primase/helicase
LAPSQVISSSRLVCCAKFQSQQTDRFETVLEPLRMLASDHQLSVLALAHPPKSGGLKAPHRILGSQAFGALARSVHVLTRDPDSDDEHRRLLLPAKANLASLGAGLALRLEQTTVADGIIPSRVAWTGEEIARSADDVLRALDAGGDDRAAREDAVELLRAELGDSERPVTELQEAARAAGISWSTVRRAQTDLKIRPRRGDGIADQGRWYWRLP